MKGSISYLAGLSVVVSVLSISGCSPTSGDSALKEKVAKYKNASPQARAALNGLKKLEARTEVGVNYADYTKTLGEQLGDVKIFLESPEAKEIPMFSAKLSEAIEHFKTAKEHFRDPDAFGAYASGREFKDYLHEAWANASRAIKEADDVLLNPEKYLAESPKQSGKPSSGR